jgi:hypothetical protein
MKLTEHQITEARNVYTLYWDSYLVEMKPSRALRTGTIQSDGVVSL